MKVKKAVVTAAGLGTRFLPATKAQPKEMLPLVDKPLIQYAVEEAVASGIKQVLIITALGKHSIEDHFDYNVELERALEKKGDRKALERVRKIAEVAAIAYTRQKEQLGLGHAVLMARELTGDEPFVVILPDDIVDSDVPCIKQMLEVYERFSSCVIAVERVKREDIKSYGIIDPEPIGERVYRVRRLVEKPSPEEAPSNLGIVGRYILTPAVFDALDRTPRGKGGEIQLTDALQILLEKEAIYAYEFEGTRYDAGTPPGYLRASVEHALRRPDIGPQFREYLRSLDLSKSWVKRK
ncbi:MAG: UTP--glucose-1-phosphate uridylyltransferase GalU [Chloroflexi bacterium]|nr:UTP--glucose-1-phosphate uridylyltransferase GalU [Chloroflexota bacterium]